VPVNDETFDAIEAITVRIRGGDYLDTRRIPIAIGSVIASVASRGPFAMSGSMADFCASLPAFIMALARALRWRNKARKAVRDPSPP